MRRRPAALRPLMRFSAAAALLLQLTRCGSDGSPSGPSTIRSVPLSGGPPAVTVCRWPADRAAAYTIGFDDFRDSHFDVARPELNRAGIKGTFYVNTRSVTRWNSLRRMAEEGHEIASHTWSHPRCSVIGENELRREIERAIEDIRNHLPAVQKVPCFSYPYGLLDESSKAVVSRYHLCARSGVEGVETGDAEHADLRALKAVGAYPPHDIDRLNAFVTDAVASRGWIIVYFHSVSDRNRSGPETIPLELFRRHLSFVLGRGDDLWMATQGQAASYLLMRQNAAVSAAVKGGDRVEVRLEGKVPDLGLPVPLSVAFNRPPEWIGREIRAEMGGSGRRIPVHEPDPSRILLDMPVPSTCTVTATQ
ncbi:MAG: polysaccharide deacetylase family protein [bacterium]|nr:polysaccharide deacetylase family protein [bacterium]